MLRAKNGHSLQFFILVDSIRFSDDILWGYLRFFGMHWATLGFRFLEMIRNSFCNFMAFSYILWNNLTFIDNLQDYFGFHRILWGPECGMFLLFLYSKICLVILKDLECKFKRFFVVFKEISIGIFKIIYF